VPHAVAREFHDSRAVQGGFASNFRDSDVAIRDSVRAAQGGCEQVVQLEQAVDSAFHGGQPAVVAVLERIWKNFPPYRTVTGEP
jgi:hypothetical protein